MVLLGGGEEVEVEKKNGLRRGHRAQRRREEMLLE
jgi:hypothetical protein